MKSIFITIFLFILFFYYALPIDGSGERKNKIIEAGPHTEQVDFGNYKSISYVSANTGSDKKGDGSKANPWQSIYKALISAANSDKENQTAVLVAEGSYTGKTLITIPFVDLYGGFESKTWERDIAAYPTILDGEKSRRVIYATNNVRIDGFTITNGLSRKSGGGILCDDTSPTISNCYITNNFVLEPEGFNNNRIHQQGNHGGGIACLYNAVPVIRNNVFYNNKTSIGNGAAISFYGWLRDDNAPERKMVNNIMEGGWQPVVKSNVFINNISGVNDWGRTRSSNGGAISCAFESRPIIENNVIVNNQAKGRSDAGGIYSENFSYPLVKQNYILGNIGDDDGGGIYVNHTGQAVIDDNYIAGNWTIGNGAGGIRVSKEGRATITNNIVVHNQTGGGITVVDGYVEMVNNIVMHNKGNSSVRFTNVFSYFRPSLIEKNIIRENEGRITIETVNEDQVKWNNNNISDNDFISNNYNKAVEFTDAVIHGVIKKTEFNNKLFMSVIEVEEPVRCY